MEKQILIVVHQKLSNPGLVGQALVQRGYTLDRRCPCIG
ncbi:MAG TPA: glutamine amidotransferase, partial [Gammaproteobacteria bacterium]|nr:glutamine amidotransferase [Gammaproteobacteria bacterium]